MPAKRAFGSKDYPELRTEKEIGEERREVARQVKSLVRMAKDNEYLGAALGRLQDRRRGRAGRLQIQTVAREGRIDVLVAADSVVARRKDLTPRLRSRLQSEFGVTCTDDERRAGRLDLPAERPDGGVLGIVDSMCGGGAPVGVNHVVPLAGVVKGAGGPEPSAGARTFPSVTFATVAPLPVVAVLDTGVSAETRSDRYLAMAVAPADIDPLDDFLPKGFLDAGAGHGAFVAGVIQQVAPDTPIHIHRALDSDGIASDTDIADRIRDAVEAGAQIVNVSLGTETVDDRPPPALLDVISDLAESHPEVLIICAAGNSANHEPIWPAALAPNYPNVVAVAALDPSGEAASWSTHGDWVTCSAIGEGVVSTYVIGKEDGQLIDDPAPDTYGEDAWATWTGTSFAAPQITGAIVRICGETGATPREALADLLARGSRIDGYGSALRILPGT